MRSSLNLSAHQALSLAALTVALSACASLRVGSEFERGTNFSGYHTSKWLARERSEASNPVVIRGTQDAVQAELIRKGFTFVRDDTVADLVVDFTIGSQERVDVASYPVDYQGLWLWGTTPFGEWGDVHRYREGTLAIDIFDARAKRPVWHGWAKKELTQSDLDRSDAPIRAAVAAVLAGFPPK